MTTVGYGDITPVTEVEYLFCIFQMLVGASLFAYVVGNMASLLGNIDSASTQLKEKLESVTEFMASTDYLSSFGTGSNNTITFRYPTVAQTGTFHETRILSELSPSLRIEVALYVHRELVSTVPFLRETNKKLAEAGQSHLMSHDVAELSTGQYFGEMGMLVGDDRRTETVWATTNVELAALSQSDLDECLLDYPDAGVVLRQLAQNRLTALQRLYRRHLAGSPGSAAEALVTQQVWQGTANPDAFDNILPECAIIDDISALLGDIGSRMEEQTTELQSRLAQFFEVFQNEEDEHNNSGAGVTSNDSRGASSSGAAQDVPPATVNIVPSSAGGLELQ
eukprot:CAMPEP_0114564900 /NCGR_PEP_ID=MMETSP0114-20121206/13995_1 /TAXON_ID=31324 /ORGANISM="Goniomonas sp, Strain m" /LENGTH=336 /DNA_ID=CAMNT_0001751055 /DNA_START=381 /DNA_END=1390 /DNA_ORIENTATION=+